MAEKSNINGPPAVYYKNNDQYVLNEYLMDTLVRNSNLMPTANEFIPSTQTQPPVNHHHRTALNFRSTPTTATSSSTTTTTTTTNNHVSNSSSAATAMTKTTTTTPQSQINIDNNQNIGNDNAQTFDGVSNISDFESQRRHQQPQHQQQHQSHQNNGAIRKTQEHRNPFSKSSRPQNKRPQRGKNKFFQPNNEHWNNSKENHHERQSQQYQPSQQRHHYDSSDDYVHSTPDDSSHNQAYNRPYKLNNRGHHSSDHHNRYDRDYRDNNSSDSRNVGSKYRDDDHYSSNNNRKYDGNHMRNGNNNYNNDYGAGPSSSSSSSAAAADHHNGSGGRYNSKQNRKYNQYERSKSNEKFSLSNGGSSGGTGGNNFPSSLNSSDSQIIVGSQREKLTQEIELNKLECLVCCEIIKNFHSIWSCCNCFHIFHLNCVIKWAQSSKTDTGDWRCPACQHINEQIPNEYYCFCGKEKNPQFNRNDVAHTCGDLCGKKDTCEHPCQLLCHPGPCPTCHANVTRSCGCGRTKKILQCCQRDTIQCEQICDKLLSCSVHHCMSVCHTDECKVCDEMITHKCYCNKDSKQVECTEENNLSKEYSCGKICNRQLTCRNHKCREICHDGDCSECPLTPARLTHCPCGKQLISADQRTSCTDAVPLCSSICGKPHKCGQPNNPHTCTVKCHQGPCPPCTKETAIKCRCGHMEQMIKCRQLFTRADDARCKKRCTKKRNCGKHKCNQECCIEIDHVCPMPCNFNLTCGKHKCDQTCHKGRCQRCYRSSFTELTCECGASIIYPPVPCGTKKPACDKPCTRTHTCQHKVQHNCHSAAVCPPCMAFTTKSCFGKHEERKTIPCSQGEFSCGLKCNKPLRCGQHKCIKICHPGICETENEICKQNCTKTRHMCTHNCNAPCHTGPCPDQACREQVEVLCQCGNRKQMRSCQDISTEYRRVASAMFASTMEEMQRGNTIDLSDVLGPAKSNNNKTLECNDNCRLLERNRKLAMCLQIQNPDVTSKLQPKYSEYIRGWAKKDPKLVESIHEKLTELVKLAKQSKQKSRSHSFPIMNRDKRQLVHEMCAMFGVESVAYDSEPNRNVVANATKESTWMPSMSIFEVLQRESGQRRIPVPTNNAWGLKR